MEMSAPANPFWILSLRVGGIAIRNIKMPFRNWLALREGKRRSNRPIAKKQTWDENWLTHKRNQTMFQYYIPDSME
ncbi:Uncharacterized protein HZ326_2473 [Fusarium oxysporum f. sp. albedinis]|nr:Uncharacterized protein HZ326_2473 [Fusarium oxysporum f. sp. albedinis]